MDLCGRSDREGLSPSRVRVAERGPWLLAERSRFFWVRLTISWMLIDHLLLAAARVVDANGLLSETL
jgi:hypothetical protein